MLEIGAGTGQHARYFAGQLPGWSWQATEHPDAMTRLHAGLAGAASDNLRPPLALDVTRDLPEGRWDAVYSANTAHIMPWPAVRAMFAGAAVALEPGGLLVLYGPFRIGGRHHAAGNAAFDAELRARPGGMGIRDLDDLDTLAAASGLERIAELRMPANNHTLVFQRTGEC